MRERMAQKGKKKAGSRGKGRGSSKAKAKDEVPTLKEKLKTLEKEKDELEDKLAYMQAEFENLKKRGQRDAENRVFRFKECMLLDLLAVVDNFERALSSTGGQDIENFAKGVRMINAQFHQVLSEHGLAPIEAQGKEFDPFKHEAVEKVEDETKPDGHIIEEVQKGYTLNGTVIRPSKVRVNVHPIKEEGKKEEEEGEKAEEVTGSQESQSDET